MSKKSGVCNTWCFPTTLGLVRHTRATYLVTYPFPGAGTHGSATYPCYIPVLHTCFSYLSFVTYPRVAMAVPCTLRTLSHTLLHTLLHTLSNIPRNIPRNIPQTIPVTNPRAAGKFGQGFRGHTHMGTSRKQGHETRWASYL